MSTATISPHTPAPSHTTRSRALGVGCAVIAALVVWMVAVPLFGADLTTRFGNGSAQTVQPGFVLAGSIVASLLGWALLAILEKRTQRAAAIWTAIAVVALLLSLISPTIAGVAASTKITLALMHLAVAAVLIPALRQTTVRG